MKYTLYITGLILLVCVTEAILPPSDLKQLRKQGGHHEVNAPKSFDWRTKGVISQVINQGPFGSSWIYAIAEDVESFHAIQNNFTLEIVSRQEVVDCCITQGGQPKSIGFECIVKIGGLCSIEAYESGSHCKNDSCKAVAKVKGTVYISRGDEKAMVEAVLKVPLVVHIQASLMSFQEYHSGIYSDTACTGRHLDHIMQLVGYGTENGVDYWILKNTWGLNWGEQGYMRIERGRNMCGISENAYYPQ